MVALGVVLLSLPFVGLTLYMWHEAGIRAVLVVWGFVLAILASISAGVVLIGMGVS